MTLIEVIIGTQFIMNLILLGVIGYIDWKTRTLPSALTTFFIIFNFLFAISSINPLGHLLMGILFLLISLFLYEIDFFKGIADIKVLTGIGLIFSTTTEMSIFLGILIIANLITYGILEIKQKLKKVKKKSKEIAYIPTLWFSYLFYLIIQNWEYLLNGILNARIIW